MTREKERLKFEKKTDLNRVYGLVSGLLLGLKVIPNSDKAGLVSVLEEVKEILSKQI